MCCLRVAHLVPASETLLLVDLLEDVDRALVLLDSLALGLCALNLCRLFVVVILGLKADLGQDVRIRDL